MIWKYIIKDLGEAMQYLPYGIMAGAVMGKKRFLWRASWLFLCTL